VPDRTARRSAVISGQLDIAKGMDMDDIPVIENAGHRVDFAPRPQVATWKVFNVSRDTPFKDKRVRQAANHAIDRAAFVEHIYRNRTRAASQCSIPGSAGYNDAVKPYAFDPAKAKALLAEAGHPNGLDVTVHAFSPSPFPGMTDVNQLVAQQWTNAGIRTKIEPVVLGDFLRNWNPGPTATTLGFRGEVFENHCNMVNLDSMDGMRDNSCLKRPAYYCDEAEQKLIEAADGEADPAKRAEILKQLMALSAGNAGMVFLVELVDLTGLHRRVQGFKSDNTRYNYHELTLAR
jgi:peptide/nickel transport system substrate-binding protein